MTNRMPLPTPATKPTGCDKPLLWDIFCQVIDNFGDVGVCWRLAAQLAQRGHRIRLWLDDRQPLQWMAPGAAQGDWQGISVHDWPSGTDLRPNPALPLADVWVEAFGCDIPSAWLQNQVHAADTQGRRPAWFNLEYLSAEPFALRSHGLPSPVMHGPAKGWTKYFFYPGFSPASGGLLRGGVAQTGDASWSDPALAAFAPAASGERTVLLFAYANAPIAALIEALHHSQQPLQLLVAAGQSADAVRLALEALTTPRSAALAHWRWGGLRLRFLPLLAQSTFDQLLRLCDLNLVRGEDSLAQAVQSGKPCVWQIYPQEDGAHAAKLQAYLQTIGADASLDAWHGFWNRSPHATEAAPALPWPWDQDSNWPERAEALAALLAQNTDLCSQLIAWAQRHNPQRPAAHS